MLTSILNVDLHRAYLEEKHRDLYQCKDIFELFSLLNLYWNYLSYDLLHQLIERLTESHEACKPIADEMTVYIRDVKAFRKRTLLRRFCQAVPHRNVHLPPDFTQLVLTFNWPDTVTLEDVEVFRNRFAQKCNLKDCAMIPQFYKLI